MSPKPKYFASVPLLGDPKPKYLHRSGRLGLRPRRSVDSRFQIPYSGALNLTNVCTKADGSTFGLAAGYEPVRKLPKSYPKLKR